MRVLQLRIKIVMSLPLVFYRFYFYHSQWCYVTVERHLLQLYFTRQLSARATVQSPLAIVETFSSRILKYSLVHMHFPGSLFPRTFKLMLYSDHQVYSLVKPYTLSVKADKWKCDYPTCEEEFCVWDIRTWVSLHQGRTETCQKVTQNRFCRVDSFPPGLLHIFSILWIW